MSVAAVRKGYADTSIGQLHFRAVEGRSYGDAAVVFFHRAPVTSASFEPLMAHLGSWRRLIAYDTPGFGQSVAKPQGASMALLVAAFIEALDAVAVDRMHLVGHHSGCHFAAELAASLPDRVASLMIDGAMLPTAAEGDRPVPPSPVPAIDREGVYAAKAWKFIVPYYTVFDEHCLHAEFVGAMQSLYTRGTTMDLVRGHDLAGSLVRVACPILASAAEDDVFVSHLDAISVCRPDALIRTYGPAGIASPELQTRAFADLVREAVSLGEREGDTP